MQKTTKQQTTVRAILQDAIDEDVTTRKAIGAAVEAEDEMVRRWLAGQLPKLPKFRLLISSPILPTTLQDSLADWFCRPTNYRMVRATEMDRTALDPNGDGIIDANDTLAFNVAAIVKGTEAMELLANQAHRGRLSEGQKATLRAIFFDQKLHVEKCLLTLDEPPVRMAQ
jgi:hypothetical protein